MACCEGKAINLEEIGRTVGQKEMGTILLNIIKANIDKGATPFTGQLSQPADPGMIAAMNTMMNIGGYGDYNAPPPPPRPTGPIGPQPISGPPAGPPAPPSSAGLRPDARVAGPVFPNPVTVYPNPTDPGVPSPGPTIPSQILPRVKPFPDPGVRTKPTTKPDPTVTAEPDPLPLSRPAVKPKAAPQQHPLPVPVQPTPQTNTRSKDPGATASENIFPVVKPPGPSSAGLRPAARSAVGPSSAGLRPDARSADVVGPPIGPPIGPPVNLYPSVFERGYVSPGRVR